MSQRDLVNAYVDGRISRRTLIRRLVAGGISVGAAVSYAHLLSPERATARPRRQGDEYYPDLGIKVKSTDLGKVINQEKVKVRVHSTKAAETEVTVGREVGQGFLIIGQTTISFAGAGNQTVKIQVQTSGLVGKNKVKVRAEVTGSGPYHGHDTDTQTLKKD